MLQTRRPKLPLLPPLSPPFSLLLNCLHALHLRNCSKRSLLTSAARKTPPPPPPPPTTSLPHSPTDPQVRPHTLALALSQTWLREFSLLKLFCDERAVGMRLLPAPTGSLGPVPLADRTLGVGASFSLMQPSFSWGTTASVGNTGTAAAGSFSTGGLAS
jgi:hypothetical protein